VSAANAFVKCQIDSLLCGFTASPVFALAGRLKFFFFWPKKKVSKEKGHPTSPSMAKNAIDVTRGILPLGLKAAPTGVQNGNPAVLSCALRK
jgi:hypothetical protein